MYISSRNMEVYPKKITETDARVRLSVSSKRLDDGFFELAAGERSREFVAFDADDERRSWRLHLRIRGRGYRKPVISDDWLNFVRDKNVRAHDTVQFSKEYYYDEAIGAEIMRYRIRVIREIQLLGGRVHALVR
ncbi:hypothetical protein WN944_008414 [Citrus x changshan-huyou]|uniref:TF-B3 domain-containing protein n=1 Tax=Citrus x changshan-huyou TaxID=2935761 RepID=A0AAP0QV85_9ROSI